MTSVPPKRGAPAAGGGKQLSVALHGSTDAKILVERAEWLSARLSFILEEAMAQSVRTPTIPLSSAPTATRHPPPIFAPQVRAAFREWAHGALFLAGMAAAGAPGGVAAALRDARAEKARLHRMPSCRSIG